MEISNIFPLFSSFRPLFSTRPCDICCRQEHTLCSTPMTILALNSPDIGARRGNTAPHECQRSWGRWSWNTPPTSTPRTPRSATAPTPTPTSISLKRQHASNEAYMPATAVGTGGSQTCVPDGSTDFGTSPKLCYSIADADSRRGKEHKDYCTLLRRNPHCQIGHQISSPSKANMPENVKTKSVSAVTSTAVPTPTEDKDKCTASVRGSKLNNGRGNSAGGRRQHPLATLYLNNSLLGSPSPSEWSPTRPQMASNATTDRWGFIQGHGFGRPRMAGKDWSDRTSAHNSIDDQDSSTVSLACQSLVPANPTRGFHLSHNVVPTRPLQSKLVFAVSPRTNARPAAVVARRAPSTTYPEADTSMRGADGVGCIGEVGYTVSSPPARRPKDKRGNRAAFRPHGHARALRSTPSVSPTTIQDPRSASNLRMAPVLQLEIFGGGVQAPSPTASLRMGPSGPFLYYSRQFPIWKR